MRNKSLITRVSSLAIAAALTASAGAQSLLGEHEVAFGSVNVLESEGTTDAFVESPSAVIDWTPDDNGMGGGDIVFQPVDTTANFYGSPGFSVLNRILVNDPSRAVALNGTINGIVNESTGGNIFFYSPSGFVVGSSAVINVGSLVLSASPITVDPDTGAFINGTTVTFGQANPGAVIRTEAGSAINALNESSYVALVAPRVEHRGSINVNGAAALVGAEGATINFRPNGLFDIQVDVGTTDANGVVIDGGVVTGVASSGDSDYHRIYAVAVPKNTALTMLISNGTELGFEVAAAADVIGNTVVLSAGNDVFSGSADFQPSLASGAPANVSLLNSSVTSALEVRAIGNIDASATTGELRLYSNADLTSTGGNVQVGAFGETALVDIAGDLFISTDRFTNTDGQSVTAGSATLLAQGGGQMFVNGDVDIWANGFGGDSFTTGVDAGNGTGGDVTIQAQAGSSLGIGGNLFVAADGFGGDPGDPGVDAGNGTGGTVSIGTSGSDASLGVNGTSFVSASGYGGDGDGSGNECSDCDGLAGNGTGGTINLGTNAGTGSSASFNGLVELYADGFGGRTTQDGATSGSGHGGTVNILAAGGSQIEGFGLTFVSDVIVSASGEGGESYVPGITAGSGEGGTVHIMASANSTMGLFGDLDVDADGLGGNNDFGVDGGDGTGGHIDLVADGGNALVSISGSVDLEADGEGSFSDSDCLSCGGIGGDGTGGTVRVYGGSGTGNDIAIAGSLDLSAEGYGGIGVTGPAGTGRGGEASMNAAAGVLITIGGDLLIEADGHGGTGFDGSSGGAGIGTTAAIYANGGTLEVTGNTSLNAGGFGGGTDFGGGGIAGNGTGGIAEIYAEGGMVEFVGDVFVGAVGEGGSSFGGTGGNGAGGSARVGTDGGTVHAFGDLTIDGGATGGSGDIGGNAVALVSIPPNELNPIAATIYVGDGGSVIVDGSATLLAEARGGDGANGKGGNGIGGEADVVAYVGEIDLGTLTIDVDGTGGAGGNGGAGGLGRGGAVDVAFGFADADIDGTITVGTTAITADGRGGAGGDGAGGNTGGNGGTGGAGTGGEVYFAGSAAGGTLNSGPATLTALGIGGAGGAGGNGDSGTGGNGGAGGNGRGGFIQTGTTSSEQAATSGGSATYTTLFLDASATGGNGGNGGTGGAGDGTGGNGGTALGGQSNLLARGVLVEADTVDLVANANGGNGGTGSTGGVGGNATTGFIAVESKDRFDHEDQRGTLNVDSITGTASAVGGTGSTNGAGIVADGSYFRVLNGDATIGSVAIELSGNSINTTDGPSLVSVRDGTAAIGSFSFVTTGELALDANNGSMVAENTITLSAANFAPDNFNPAPTVVGSYAADSFDITTGGDFVTNAVLDSATDLFIAAPGSITAVDLIAAGAVTLEAEGSTVTVGDISAGGSVDIDAPITVTTGDINSGGNILIGSNTIIGGDMTAAGFIDLFAGGIDTIDVGDLSGDGIYLMSIGNITTGTIDSTLDVDLTSFDGSITTGDITAATDISADADLGMNLGSLSGQTVTLLAGGQIVSGDILADQVTVTGGSLALGGISGSVIDLTSTTGDVSTGDLFAFSSLNILSAADILFGSIIAPVVDLNAPGSIIGGSIDSDSDITAFAGGDIDVGELTAGFDGEGMTFGDILLSAGGDISTGDATAVGFIEMYAETGSISTGNLDALDAIYLDAAGDIGFGNVAAQGFDFDSGGAVTGGNIVADSYATGEALGAIVVGDITVGPDMPSEGDISVGFASATSITVGDVSAPGPVGFATFGNLVTGDIVAGNLIMALVGGDITVGSLTTSPQGEVYLADAQMYLDAGGTQDEFNPLQVLALDPLATGGSITIAGPVSTGRFRAAAGNDLSTQAITANSIEASAGGTATINGEWQAPNIALRSSDIEIGEAGGMNAGAQGEILLMSSSSGGALIGDGLTGEGYALSNAEFGRLSAGDITIVAGGVAGADGDMLIGDLTITGPLAGSNIESAEGGVSFVSLDEAGTELDGTIRVVGEVNATGFGADNYLAFLAQNFQLDAATGLINIESTPGVLSGILYLEAANIHVASGEILDRLEEDPQYEGYQDDLNAPADVPRPEGVVRAGTVEIEFVPADLNTLYVQNTGTDELPAGFLISDLNLGDDGEGGLPPGSIDLIINGQIVTADGTITGIDVRDLLVEGRDLTPFTENSTINGCLLVGGCEQPGGGGGISDDPQFTPLPGIPTEIRLITQNLLPPPKFDNEDFIDDNDETTDEGASSPIEPPQPLFDTSGLGAKGDVDDPVSGSGNPALMETPAPSSSTEKQQ